MMVKGSSLNPLASTFIPSSVMGVVTEEVLNSDPKATKSILVTTIASNFTEIVAKRKEHGVRTSEDEIRRFAIRLISFHYNIKTRNEIMRAAAYVSEKIPVKLRIKESEESPSSVKTDHRKFDLSVCRIPPPTILLVAFYGLYRHEQAFRPLLSLAHRPKVFQDKVWSLTDKDLKLWNPSVAKPCSCPPMFGYHIPADFFGNPFKLSNPCPKKQIHLCRSQESSKGNEFILLERAQNDQIAETKFVDFEEKLDLDPRSDLDYYSKQMKDIVNSVCSLIGDYDTAENVPEDEIEEDYVSNFLDSLWNTHDSELSTPKSDQLYDDDHPLLNVELDDEDLVGEVPMEVKELLRKSFSNEWDPEVAPSSCDPPCSVWCSKLERSNSSQSGRKSDSSAIDLLNETTQFLTDISSCSETRQSKPSFKRSFSANDCDHCHNYTWLPKSFLVNNRRISSDSGIMLSQEDDDEECDEESNDMAPMWTLFSGEHSLWKPLPASEQSKATHKRARDLKRQISSVN